jgi:predicted CDP-diglyceride synthetase/phosphatidate cytidylyltransferase
MKWRRWLQEEEEEEEKEQQRLRMRTRWWVMVLVQTCSFMMADSSLSRSL